ncbi:hypothetical protein Tco_0702104 [Tanacetum coccineum]|uniref:Zinc finger, CCHC-type n=1 Tax=Tanacetum coccineum TaxID=301880 RepID=A0ABQ4XWJ6_9ASTR
MVLIFQRFPSIFDSRRGFVFLKGFLFDRLRKKGIALRVKTYIDKQGFLQTGYFAKSCFMWVNSQKVKRLAKVKRMMTGTEFDIEKFDRKNDFRLWQVRMKALLEQQGLATGGEEIGQRDIGVGYNHKKSLGCVRIKDHVFGFGADRNAVYGEDFKYEMWVGVKFRVGQCQRSTQQCTKSGVAKNLGVAGLQQQNGLVEETNVTLLAKVVLYRNMGFNESGEYKKTFIGSGVGTGSVQVLQGVEFEVEPQEDHTFEVEPHGNVDWKLFSYREDSNEAAFAWKAGLKDDMDVRSDVYVLSNGCKKCSDDNDVYYWEYTPVQFYNGKLVHTLLEGHFILSLEGSLLRDCDVEKNGKWSCIYAVGSPEYQVVCTRLDIASTDVGVLDKFDRGLQTDVQNFVDYDYTMGRSITVMVGYMTLTEAAKEAIWLKGLAIESGFELKIVAGIATDALSKAIPGPRFQHRLNLLSIGIG